MNKQQTISPHFKAMRLRSAEPEQVVTYTAIVGRAVKGYATIGSFPDNGPKKCSGLPVAQYNETSLTAALCENFQKLQCITEDHITPFGASQYFLFCSFKRILKL